MPACDILFQNTKFWFGAFRFFFTFFNDQRTSCGTSVSAMTGFARSFWTDFYCFYILHLATAFHPRARMGRDGHWVFSFYRPGYPAGLLHLARVSNGGFWVLIFWDGITGMIEGQGLGYAPCSPLVCGRFCLLMKRFLWETAEAKSGTAGFLLC